jgi:Ubiquitin-activating enzyme E1 FCCH domain/Baseplate J-like protein
MAQITTAGAIPASPTDLLNAEIAAATVLAPGLTANLPGSLVEDMASTAAGAVYIQDQAFVDLVNSISPATANPSILYQLGQVYGVEQGQGSNTSVYVVFTGLAGFVIPIGFTVSDGSYQYTVQDGGIIATSGQTSPLYCLATVQGSWAIPAGTVTQIITSVPAGFTLTVTNPDDGLPGLTAQTIASYQAQVMQAGMVTAQGVPTFIKAQLQKVLGVQARLISIRLIATNQWEIIVGGGDPYQVANAIFNSVPDISNLVGSTLAVTAITTANPGVVTTDLNHGYATGQVITIAGVNPVWFNNNYTITVIDEKSFSLGVTTVGHAYVSGGVVTPNLRNITVSVDDYPDVYSITFVNPPSQTVQIVITWNTISTNLISPTAVAQLTTPAIVAYINSISVGQPINTYELQDAFQNAVAPIVPPSQVSKIDYVVAINGIDTAPTSGTLLIYGDPESYFSTNDSLVSVVQG